MESGGGKGAGSRREQTRVAAWPEPLPQRSQATHNRAFKATTGSFFSFFFLLSFFFSFFSPWQPERRGIRSDVRWRRRGEQRIRARRVGAAGTARPKHMDYLVSRRQQTLPGRVGAEDLSGV